MPGVSFRIASARQRTTGSELRNIQVDAGFMTSGSPLWWIKVIDDPGRNLFIQGLHPPYAQGCRLGWMRLHEMNHVTDKNRTLLLAKSSREVSALPR